MKDYASYTDIHLPNFYGVGTDMPLKKSIADINLSCTIMPGTSYGVKRKPRT